MHQLHAIGCWILKIMQSPWCFIGTTHWCWDHGIMLCTFSRVADIKVNMAVSIAKDTPKKKKQKQDACKLSGAKVGIKRRHLWTLFPKPYMWLFLWSWCDTTWSKKHLEQKMRKAPSQPSPTSLLSCLLLSFLDIFIKTPVPTVTAAMLTFITVSHPAGLSVSLWVLRCCSFRYTQLRA